MKTILKMFLIIVVLFVFILAEVSNASAHRLSSVSGPSTPSVQTKPGSQLQQPDGDKLVIGDNFMLGTGETLNGNLLVIGGTAKLEQGSTVEGDIMVMGGTLVASGDVMGDVNALSGLVTLENTAHVRGDVNTLAAQMEKDEAATIDGKINEMKGNPLSVFVPGGVHLPNWQGMPPITLPGSTVPRALNTQMDMFWGFLWWLIRSFIWAAIAMVVSLFVPGSISKTAKAAVAKPFAAGGLGCFTMMIVPLLLALIALTICGIPFSLIGAFLLWLAWGLGIIALGAETGNRLTGFMKVDWAVPVTTGLGTFVLTLVSNGVELLVPCLGWTIPVLIGLVGIGAVLLTRFGTKPFPFHEESQAPMSPVISPASGEPPIDIATGDDLPPD